MLDRLSEAFRRSRDQSARRGELQRVVEEALADGILTDAEWERIDRKREELNLSPNDLQRFRTAVLTRALETAKADARLTPDEEASLSRIVTHFGVPQQQLERTIKELARYKLLYEIEQGNLPEAVVRGLVLRKGEIVHWVEAGALLEERVIRRRYEGGSSGVSFRVMKGVTFRVGASRGHLISETGIVPVSSGEFILTNKRIIFSGNQKSASCRWDKVLDVELFADGARVSLTSRAKPLLIRFNRQGNSDILGTIVSYMVNHYRA